MITNITRNGQTTEITELVSVINWSGSLDNVSRMVELTIAHSVHDIFTPQIQLNIGDIVSILTDDNNQIFTGKVFYIQRNNEQGTVSVTCYDDGIRLVKSTCTHNFTDKAPEFGATVICNELNIQIGNLQPTNIPITMLHDNKNCNDAIVEHYQEVGQLNQKQYYAFFNGTFNVYEVGTFTSPVILSPETNIIQSNYEENAEGVINRVLVFDENNKMGTVQDNESISLLGVFQSIYKKEEGKQALTVASSMLKAITQTMTLNVLGDISLLSGSRVQVLDHTTGIIGMFIISSDNHTWDSGVHTTSLDLIFEGVQNET